MDDVYDLLARNKLEEESFSDEIRRIFEKRNGRSLKDYFGILSGDEGKAISEFLEIKRKRNIALKKERLKELI